MKRTTEEFGKELFQFVIAGGSIEDFVYQEINKWENEAGEGFYDYGEHLFPIPYFTGFLLGKGYLRVARKLSKKMDNKEIIPLPDVLELLCENESDYFDEETSYDLFNKLLAEFIAGGESHMENFREFLNTN